MCKPIACKNILLVDDNEVIGKLARKLLLSMGMVVTMAYDGQTALRYGAIISVLFSSRQILAPPLAWSATGRACCMVLGAGPYL